MLYQLGETKGEFGGSHFSKMADGRRQTAENKSVPTLDISRAKKMYEMLHTAMMRGLVRSAHDLSEGGLAVSVAEMCIAGGLGARLFDDFLDEATLFSESNSRFIIEVAPEHTTEIESLFEDVLADYPIHWFRIGTVTAEPVLSLGDLFSVDLFSVSVDELKTAWQKPLDW